MKSHEVDVKLNEKCLSALCKGKKPRKRRENDEVGVGKEYQTRGKKVK
jgi:hypothetical protein